ncbi:MAG: segregation/condensation protein A [Phycisphaerae bacterium]|nr:segregation/condensation protein A [Phycisphaerae bacterium]
MSVMDDYRVHLDAFEGPLDLLLFLIRKDEVDITDIPVASITEQYLSFLKGIERIDIELAGEFLVMAATLMEIKSRMLMPAPARAAALAADAGRADDPRAELVRQLLAYKQYRDAAAALEQRHHDWANRFPAGHASVDDDRLREAMESMDRVDLGDVGLVDLAEAFRKIVESVNFDRLGDHQVTYDDTPIELHAQDILDRIRSLPAPGEGARTLEFSQVFQGRTRSELIGLFLAVLDLVRRSLVAVKQEAIGGAITLSEREETDVIPATIPAEHHGDSV